MAAWPVAMLLGNARQLVTPFPGADASVAMAYASKLGRAMVACKEEHRRTSDSGIVVHHELELFP
jgi:hypothetical protein